MAIDPHYSKICAYVFEYPIGETTLYTTGYAPVIGLQQIIREMSHLGLVLIEEPYYKINADTYKKLCYAVGAFIFTCIAAGVGYKLIRPTDWKRYFGHTKLKKTGLWDLHRIELVGNHDDDIQDALLILKYYKEKLYDEADFR